MSLLVLQLMNSQRCIWLLKAELLALLLAVSLYGGSVFVWPGSTFSQAGRLFDAKNQWLMMLGVVTLLSVAVLFRWRFKQRSFKGELHADIFLLACTLFGVGASIFQFETMARSPQVIVWLWGMAMGQVVLGLCYSSREGRQESEYCGFLHMFAFVAVLCFLSAGSMVNLSLPIDYYYRDHVRWSGAWDNPNQFGLLMGTGLVLSTGMLAFFMRTLRAFQGLGNIVFAMGCLVGMLLLARGLLHSYSRGSWFGVIFGLSYLVINGRYVTGRWRWRGSIIPLVVIVISIMVLAYWQFGQTQNVLLRRFFSVSNGNDFSRGNRIEAMKGALQMMGERPWGGFGWSRAEDSYEYYYLSTKVFNGQAFEMNNYFMMGASVGIPAMLCFGMYLWQVFKLSARRKSDAESQKVEWFQVTGRAATLVLVVGFWFDGGLFQLATTSTFWILLELGNVYYCESNKICEK